MKKNFTKIRVFVLGLAMAMTTTTLFAQKSDGFFSSYNNEDNRDNEEISGEISVTPLTEDDSAPLGSGLLVMMATGASYVVLKKRRD